MFIPDDKRYDKMIYNRCGKSGLKLSAVSLGFWQNFSLKNNFENMESPFTLLRICIWIHCLHMARR